MDNLYNPYVQAHSTINGHGVWWYLISTTIGDFNVVEFEDKGMEVKRFVFDENHSGAEKKYNKICMELVKGKHL